MSQTKHNFVIAVCARWENDSILEWLTFHRNIGFDHVYLYCNDDDPFGLYEVVLPFTLGSDPFVTFHHFGLQGQQEMMYFHFLNNYSSQCNYFTFIDIDEFILLRRHNNIGRYIETFNCNPDAIHFYSVTAGHNGHGTRPSGLAIKNFTKRSNTASMFTKVVFKSESVCEKKVKLAHRSAFWHNATAIMKDESIIIDVLGEDMRRHYFTTDRWGEKSSNVVLHNKIVDEAFIYHIAMKSEEDLLRRYKRGVGGQFYGQSTWNDLYERGPEQIKSYLDQYNVCDEHRLLEQWEAMCADALKGQIVAKPSGTNLALNRPAMQSSVSPWSSSQNLEQDARAVVNGHLHAGYAHHTNIEESPWWLVDLEQVRTISRIHVYNRSDAVRDRLRNFDVHGSLDGDNWEMIFSKTDSIPFGGSDGTPYIYYPPLPISHRYIKIVGHGISHLDFSQVEIY